MLDKFYDIYKSIFVVHICYTILFIYYYKFIITNKMGNDPPAISNGPQQKLN